MCPHKAITFFHTRLEAGSARRGLGREQILIPCAPVSISMITPFLSKPKFCYSDRPFPRSKSKLQLFAVPINQQLRVEWQSKETAQFSKSPKAFFIEFNISECFFSNVKAVNLFKWKQHLGINSGTWVLGDYRYASWTFLLSF